MNASEESRLKACQKRSIFKTAFGELLLKQDFHFHENRFIRYHKNEVLLSVGMDLSGDGVCSIRFGGMPLCAEGFDPATRFGETVSDFSRIHPVAENPRQLTFEGQFDSQLTLFRSHLMEAFTAIDSVSSLLDYQERILEDRLGMMRADWAAWESIYLRDYERAWRYAQVWLKLEQERFDAWEKRSIENIRSADCVKRDRETLRKDFNFREKRKLHFVYRVQRLIHLLDTGAYPLLQENIKDNIAASNAAFQDYYPKYR